MRSGQCSPFKPQGWLSAMFIQRLLVHQLYLLFQLGGILAHQAHPLNDVFFLLKPGISNLNIDSLVFDVLTPQTIKNRPSALPDCLILVEQLCCQPPLSCGATIQCKRSILQYCLLHNFKSNLCSYSKKSQKIALQAKINRQVI